MRAAVVHYEEEIVMNCGNCGTDHDNGDTLVKMRTDGLTWFSVVGTFVCMCLSRLKIPFTGWSHMCPKDGTQEQCSNYE